MSSARSNNDYLLVADTGPLLALARIDQLGLLSKLFNHVQVTQAVFDECLAKPERRDAILVSDAYDQKLFSVANNPEVSSRFAGLDAGESTTLELALKLNAMSLIDEAKGRSIAKRNNIKIIGSAGILLLAKRRGLITEVMPLVESLRESGYHLGVALVKNLKELANE